MSSLLVLGILVAAGLGMFIVGIRGVISKQVHIYSGKWFVVILALCFLPNFINSLSLFSVAPQVAFFSFLIYPVCLLIFYMAFKGYTAFGMTEDLLNSGIKTALSKMGLEYEQSLSVLKLKDGRTISVALSEIFGTAQIKAKNKDSREVTDQLVVNLKEYYAGSPGPYKALGYWLYLVMGSLMLIVMIGLLVKFLGLANR